MVMFWYNCVLGLNLSLISLYPYCVSVVPVVVEARGSSPTAVVDQVVCSATWEQTQITSTCLLYSVHLTTARRGRRQSTRLVYIAAVNGRKSSISGEATASGEPYKTALLLFLIRHISSLNTTLYYPYCVRPSTVHVT